MNIQQFSNPQFWTSLFPNWWSVISISSSIAWWLGCCIFDQGHRRTKIMILCVGSLSFSWLKFLANFLGLTTISWLINQVITYGVIALVVIFSPEIRIGLERLGRATEFFTTSEVSQEEKMVTGLC